MTLSEYGTLKIVPRMPVVLPAMPASPLPEYTIDEDWSKKSRGASLQVWEDGSNTRDVRAILLATFVQECWWTIRLDSPAYAHSTLERQLSTAIYFFNLRSITLYRSIVSIPILNALAQMTGLRAVVFDACSAALPSGREQEVYPYRRRWTSFTLLRTVYMESYIRKHPASLVDIAHMEYLAVDDLYLAAALLLEPLPCFKELWIEVEADYAGGIPDILQRAPNLVRLTTLCLGRLEANTLPSGVGLSLTEISAHSIIALTLIAGRPVSSAICCPPLLLHQTSVSRLSEP